MVCNTTTGFNYFHAQIVTNLAWATFKCLTTYPSEQILIIELAYHEDSVCQGILQG